MSNSPSDTGPLTFRCTLSTEGISPPPRSCLFSSSVTAAVAFWGLRPGPRGGGGRSVLSWRRVSGFDPHTGTWFPRQAAGLEADSGQTCYLLPETPLRKLSGGITATRHLPQSSSPRTLPSLFFTNSLHSNTSDIHHTLMSCRDSRAEGSLYSERNPVFPPFEIAVWLRILIGFGGNRFTRLSVLSFERTTYHSGG